MIALIMTVVMVLSLCTVAFATDTTTTTTVTPELPSGSVTATAPQDVISITVNDDTAVYQKDLKKDSTTEVADQVYIRAIDNGGTEDTLRKATIKIVASDELDFSVKTIWMRPSPLMRVLILPEIPFIRQIRLICLTKKQL